MMLWKKALLGELDRVASRHGSPEVVVEMPEGRLLGQFTAADPLACSFQQFAYQTSQLATADSTRLKQVCERLSQRLTYLLEPIRTLEVDDETCTVQMRSVPPQRDEDGTTYYELLARRGGQISLQRYRKAPQQPRAPIAATLTREVLLRLAGDLATAINP